MREVEPKLKLIPNGQIRFTKDPLSMQNIDFSEIQTPKIKNHTRAKPSKRDPNKLMDKI